jgi:hypothetical protein
MNIFDRLQDDDWCVEFVTKFFNGKYDPDTVRRLLFHHDEELPGNPRDGVRQLAAEWNAAVDTTKESSIVEWYGSTDYYVFDLLPWNACDGFKEKVDRIANFIKLHPFKYVTDFGGGLGIALIYLSQLFPDIHWTYVDIRDGVTWQFAKAMFKEFNVSVDMLDVDDFTDHSNYSDLVLAMDVLEHVFDLDKTIGNIARNAPVLYHDSTFDTHMWSPQHIQTPSAMEFLNVVGKHNYLVVEDDIRMLWTSHVKYVDDGQGVYVELVLDELQS